MQHVDFSGLALAPAGSSVPSIQSNTVILAGAAVRELESTKAEKRPLMFSPTRLTNLETLSNSPRHFPYLLATRRLLVSKEWASESCRPT